MPPTEWQAHLQAYQQKQARARAWEARLHGLRHKSGRALTAEDFLPDASKSERERTPEAVFAAFATAFAPIQKNAPARPAVPPPSSP